MENFKICKLKFVNECGNYKMDAETINNLVSELNNNLSKDNLNFAGLCYLVDQIELFFYDCGKTDGYGGIYTTNSERYYFSRLMSEFGFCEKTYDRILKVYKRFVEIRDDVVPVIKKQYENFSRSKLFEILSVSDTQLKTDLKNGKLKPEMTVKEIREYVKQLKNGSGGADKVLEDQSDETDEINEDEIPMAYDPAQTYEFSYFENLSKNQLLNIVWELQKYAHPKQRKIKSV